MIDPEPQQNPVSPEAIAQGYEPETVPTRGIVRALPVVVVTLLAIQLTLWWWVKRSNQQTADADAPRSAVALDANPPPPNLQPSVGHDAMPSDDLESLRREEDAIFTKLGWQVNGNLHRVAIPDEIARAVAQAREVRLARGFVPPTNTGGNTNSISPDRATTAPSSPREEGRP